MSLVPVRAASRLAERRRAGAAPDVACYHCGLPNPRPARWRAPWSPARSARSAAPAAAAVAADDSRRRPRCLLRRSAPSRATARRRRERDDEWTRWDDRGGAGRVSSGRCRRRRARGLAAARGHPLRRLRLADRDAGSRGSRVSRERERQLRDAPRARGRLDPAATRALRRAARGRGDRLSRAIPTIRRGARRSRARESRALLLRMAIALLAMMQVMMFAVPTYITVDGVEPEHRLLLEWASLTLTLPALLYSASPFFRGAWRDLVLRAAGHGRAGRARPRAPRSARAPGRRFGGEGAVYYDSVTMFVALLLRRALRRTGRAPARRRRGRGGRAGAAGDGRAAARLAAAPRRRDRRRRHARRRRRRCWCAPGATIPADGVVVEGRAAVEEAMLTGESRPRAQRARASACLRAASRATARWSCG